MSGKQTTRPATSHDGPDAFVPSPARGVHRRMLDRIGDEVARATTIVRFAADAEFHQHTHDGGEEFLVLDGTFSDQYGDFGPGSYIRNPPTSSHAPHSDGGTTIFVKLWQMAPEDRTFVRLRAQDIDPQPVTDGIRAQILHKDATEEVRIEVWSPGTQAHGTSDKGAEILVIDGGFEFDGEAYGKRSWLRVPAGQPYRVRATEEGARVWIKEGHLAPENIRIPG